MDIESGFDRLTDLTQRFTKQGFEIVINSPSEVSAFFKEEIDRWAKASGAAAD